jgi:hypothetical protein
MIGGHCILQTNSIKEAIEWASRFAEVLCEGREVSEVEVDIRPLYEEPYVVPDVTAVAPAN